MDTWGLAIAGISIVLYFAAGKKTFFLLTTGVGIGIVIGALWSMYLVESVMGYY